MIQEPPKKKRRLAMPEFESSFDLSSRDGRLTGKKTKNLKGIISNSKEENSLEKTFPPAKHVTPIKTPRIAHPALNPPSKVVSPSVEYVRKSTHVSRVSDTFSGPSSTFGAETRRITTPTTPAKPLPHVATKIQDEDGTTLSTGAFKSFCNNAVQTPTRVFAPLRLQATRIPNSLCHSRNTVTPIPLKVNKAGIKNDVSLASRLPLKLDFVFESPIKVLGSTSTSPNMTPNNEHPIAFSKLSHSERAERLVQSVHETHKSMQTKTYPDLVRGMNISPHKDIGGGRNLVRSVKRHILELRSSCTFSGGFAERVRHLLSRSKTDMVLWEKERNQDRLKTSKGVFCLRILSILSTTYSPSATRQPTFSVNSRAILARCSFLEGHSVCPNLVVFLFPPTKSTVNFEVGKKIEIWSPWHEINIPLNDEVTGSRRRVKNMEPSMTALLCSRFFMVS